MNNKQNLIVPLLALLVSGTAMAHGSFARDAYGHFVFASGSCLRTIDYNSRDDALCPLNQKAAMVKPVVKPKPAPVVMKKPTPVKVMAPKPVVKVKKPMPVVASKPAPKPTPIVKKIIHLDGVNFASGSDRLVGGSLNTLDSAVQSLKTYPNTKIVVEGYTDDRGDAAMNKRLSQARAEAVMKQLISQGISADNISAKGFGEEHAISSNDTAAGRLKNRRVELRILK